MKTIILTVLFMLVSPSVHAMTHQTARDLASASEDAMNELNALNKNFDISIHNRVAASAELPTNQDNSVLVARPEVETLPGSEVAEPWVLASPEASLNVSDRKDVGPFETAQLLPSNRTGDRRAALSTQ
jgi:hypothetical protein